MDAILDAIDDQDGGAMDQLMDAPVFLPGELEGTDEEIMAMKVEDIEASEHGDDEDLDQFQGDPLLIGADGKPLTDDQLKMLYTISRYSPKAW